jgi:hypothetical protein
MNNIKYYMLCSGNKHPNNSVLKSRLQCLPSRKKNHALPISLGHNYPEPCPEYPCLKTFFENEAR